MTELIDRINTKFNEIMNKTRSGIIRTLNNELRTITNNLFNENNGLFSRNNDLINKNNDLLKEINKLKAQLNERDDQSYRQEILITTLIKQNKELKNENIGLKSLQINEERRRNKNKHKRQHIIESCDEVIDLYNDVNKQNKIIKQQHKRIITIQDNSQVYEKMKLLAAKIVSKLKFGKFEIDLARNTSYSEMNTNDNYWRLKVSNWFDCKNKITLQKETDKFWYGETSQRLKSLPEYESIIKRNGKTHVLITSMEQFIHLLFWLKFHNIHHMINSSEFNEDLKSHIKNYFLNQRFIALTLVLDKLFSMSFSKLNQFLDSIESFGASFYEVVNNDGTTQDINYFMIYKQNNADNYNYEIISNETKTNFGFNFVDINLFIGQITQDLITKLNDDDNVIKTILIDKFEHALSNESNEVYTNELIKENNCKSINRVVVGKINRKNYIITNNNILKTEIKTDFNYNRNFDMKNKIEFSRNLHISNDTFIIGESRGILRRLVYAQRNKDSRKPSVCISNKYFIKNKSHFINEMIEENYNFVDHNYVIEPDSLVVSF